MCGLAEGTRAPIVGKNKTHAHKVDANFSVAFMHVKRVFFVEKIINKKNMQRHFLADLKSATSPTKSSNSIIALFKLLD